MIDFLRVENRHRVCRRDGCCVFILIPIPFIIFIRDILLRLVDFSASKI